MSTFNLSPSALIDENYQNGLLPQRNNKDLFYMETSCRSNLSNFALSSENRRILRKTENYSYKLIPTSDFNYTSEIQKNIHNWIKELGWDFPTSSVKTIFTNHIFNYIYVCYDHDTPVAYGIAYINDTFSHIAYLFYNPKFSHNDLPIGIVLQFIIDSQKMGLNFVYLGRFSNYKKNMPGFENFDNNQWKKL